MVPEERAGNVGLLHATFAEPFGEDVGHCLWGEGDGEICAAFRGLCSYSCGCSETHDILGYVYVHWLFQEAQYGNVRSDR